MTKVKHGNMFVKSNEYPSQKKIKKMKKKKDLEKMRKNVLAAKQQMKRNSRKQEKITKSSFEKVLNNFAQIRQKNEDQTQGCTDKTVEKKTICARLLPEQSIGIFKNGAMGKEVRRTSKPLFSQQNEARLRGDIFKLLNGEEIPSPDESVTENEKIEENSSRPTAKNNDKDTTNHGSINSKSRDTHVKKHSNKQKCAKTQNQSDKTKRLFEDNDDNNKEDPNLDSIPSDPLHFSPRAGGSETKDSQKDDGNDKTDGGKSEHCWDPKAYELYEELWDEIEEYFDVDFSKLNMQDPATEIKSRLANIYERTRRKRSASSNNNDTYPFPSTSQSHSEWTDEAQAYTGTSDNNDSVPLNPFTKSKSPPHDYETVEARIIKAMASLPTEPEFSLADPFFGVRSPKYTASLSPVSSGTFIRSNHGNVDKTTTEQDINTSPLSKRSETEFIGGKNIAETNFTESVTSLSSLPLGWDAKAENERNLIRRNLKHVPAIPRRTQPREILFDVKHLSKAKAPTAQVPTAQTQPKVTLIQEQVRIKPPLAPAAQAHCYAEPKVIQTQAHPLQTETCRKINIANNHEFFPLEFFPPLLPNDKSSYPGPLDKELSYYPTPSIVMHQLNQNRDKNKNKDSKSKDNFMIPELRTKFINSNPYGEIMKATRDEWNTQFPPPPPPPPPPRLLTRNVDTETNSRYPFKFSSNDFLKSRTGILKDDYARFNGEKRELNKPIVSTKLPPPPPAAAISSEQKNLNGHKQFPYTSQDLNTESFKLFPKYNQHGGYQTQPQLVQNQQNLHKSTMYEPIPISGKNEGTNYNHKSMFGGSDDFFVKSKALPKKSAVTRNLGYEVDRSKLSFRSLDSSNYNYKLQDNGISDTVLEDLKVLSFDEDQYPKELFIDNHNHSHYYNNNPGGGECEESQKQPLYYQGYCQQEQLGNHSQKLSQPSKYLAVMNEHQSYPRVPQRVPIYFNEPASINNHPQGSGNSEKYQPHRKQIQPGVPVAVFAAKDRNLYKHPDPRHVFRDRVKEDAEDNGNYLRLNEDRPMRDGNQIQFNDQMARNQVREIILPNGQVGLFVPQTYVSESGASNNNVYSNQNRYQNYM